MNLTEWLLEQVAHDEATALAAGSASWSLDDDPADVWREDLDGQPHLVAGRVADEDDAAHIAANDPAETLRRCAAVRVVVKLHADHTYAGFGWCVVYDGDDYEALGKTTPCPTLTALAGMYADRDGYAAVKE